MKQKKLISVLLLLAFSALLFAGCSKSTEKKTNEGTNTNEKKVEKNVVVDVFQFKVEFRDAFIEAAKEYEKSHPGTTINITTVGGGEDYGAALKAKFNSGEEPAIFNVGGPSDVQTWKSKLADVSDSQAAKDALSGTLSGVTVDGKVFGLPYNIEGYGLIYNKEIFEKAGIDTTALNTYSKFEEAVKTLDSQKDKLGIQAVFAFPAKETWVTGLHLSNVFFSSEFDGDILKIFNAKNIEFKYADAMKKIVDLQNKYSVQPTASLDYSSQVEKLFSNGKVAIIQQGNWVYPTVSDIDENFANNGMGILPYPVPGVKEDCYPVGVPMYWAVNTGKSQEVQKAAKDFIDWLYLSDAGKKIVVEKFKFIPAYKGYSSDSVVDPLGKQLLTAANEGKTINWVFMGYPDGWGMNKLGADIQLYVNGSLDWNEVVEKAKASWAEARK